MIIDNKSIEITKYDNNIPGLDTVLKFIDLIQANYELEEVPDIFSENIPSSELGLLWNLDKEKKNYSFQDALFYDNYIDKEGKITSITWQLSFERYILGSNDNSKKEVLIYVTVDFLDDNNFKISNISISE